MSASENRVLMTQQGFDEMNEKLDNMVERRVLVLEEKERAREKGDLSENAEYQEARNEQNLLDIEIAKYKSILGTALVVDVRAQAQSGKKIVSFGATVTMVDIMTDQEIRYKIVSEYESDLERGLLSINSPIGRQTIKKSVDDLVQVETPKGTKTYKIIAVEYI